MDDLKWLGIMWDEGPEAGGPNGPYLQSQRKDIYDKYIKKLLDQKKAYYCFDTPEELDALRQNADAQKKNLSYPRPEKFTDDADAEKARAEGRPVTVRFAVPRDEPIVVQDMVRGEITFAAGEIGDFIILKSDGFPTYNFACVVDDCLMEVTHVIRGQEHLNNTPGQQALWQALEFGEPPNYAHMSVTISETSGKLSKRERPNALREKMSSVPDLNIETIATVTGVPATSVVDFMAGKSTPDMPVIDKMAEFLKVPLPEINIVDFFKSGYLPETMVNFLALLGWNPGDDREIMKIDELIEAFDISRLTKSNSLFDRQKLLAFNTEHIKMAPPEKLLQHLRNYLREVKSPLNKAKDEQLQEVIRLCEGARTLADIDCKSKFLFEGKEEIKKEIEKEDKNVKKVLYKEGVTEILSSISSKINAEAQITAQYTEQVLRELADEKKVGLGKVAQPLRVAISGTTISLPIFESVEMLGTKETLARIDQTIKIVEGKATAGGT
jgi:glutamyl/glutaminyl-tRNA synthetase